MTLAVAFAALTLYQQIIKGLLEQRFARDEFLLLHAETGQMIAGNWQDHERPTPVGSLVKPLLVAAYGREYPTIQCNGKRCWRPRGHGGIDVIRAIAQSCNEYFESLGSSIPRERVGSFVARYALTPPVRGGSLIGRGLDWRLSPVGLMNAYRALSHHPAIREGMRQAASNGTAAALHGGALAKTGTSECGHTGGGQGDGLVMVLFPEAKPEWALLLRVHGTTGATAARRAQEIVKTVRQGK